MPRSPALLRRLVGAGGASRRSGRGSPRRSARVGLRFGGPPPFAAASSLQRFLRAAWLALRRRRDLRSSPTAPVRPRACLAPRRLSRGLRSCGAGLAARRASAAPPPSLLRSQGAYCARLRRACFNAPAPCSFQGLFPAALCLGGKESPPVPLRGTGGHEKSITSNAALQQFVTVYTSENVIA